MKSVFCRKSVDFIKSQITSPKIVILLLTPQYYNSNFCLCELGAAWALSHKVIPIIVEPLTYNDVKDVLTGVQLLKIKDKVDLNQFQGEIIEALNFTAKSFARWEVKRDIFLEYISANDFSLSSTTVSKLEFDKLKKKYEGSVTEIKELINDNDSKDKLIRTIKELKDKDDVLELLKEDMSSFDEFKEVKKSCVEALNNLPSIVVDALYYKYRGEALHWPGYGDDYRSDSIKEAIEADYLVDEGDGEGISVVTDDPKIRKAIKVIDDFNILVDNLQLDEDFVEFYENEFDHRLEFKSKRFWDQHLI